MGKVVKVKVLFFLLYLLWFTNGTGGYYTWNLDDQALSPPPVQDSRFMILSLANKGKILWKFLKFDHKMKVKYTKFHHINKNHAFYG